MLAAHRFSVVENLDKLKCEGLDFQSGAEFGSDLWIRRASGPPPRLSRLRCISYGGTSLGVFRSRSALCSQMSGFRESSTSLTPFLLWPRTSHRLRNGSGNGQETEGPMGQFSLLWDWGRALSR